MSFRDRIARPPVNDDVELVSSMYRKAFSTAEGQFVLDHICQVLCGVDQPLFKPHELGIAYNVARRDVGLDIYRLANVIKGRPEVKT